MATSLSPEGVSPLARSNAARWRTHIRRRNRKRSDDAVAAVRSAAAVIRVSATSSSFDNPSVGNDCGIASFIPALRPSLRVYFPDRPIICVAQKWVSGIRDGHHVLEHLQ